MDFASGSISATSDATWIETRPGWASLLLLSVYLLMAMAAGCDGGQLPADDSAPYATSLAGDDQPSSPAFPRHHAPLGTDRGEEYFAGRLVLEEGCLRVEVPSNEATTPPPSWLVIWPDSFKLEEESGAIRVIDGLGRTTAKVGDHIRVSRAAVTYQQTKDPGMVTGRPEHCAPPSTWVGDEVTVFDPKSEVTELRLSDPDVLFLQQKTVMSIQRVFNLAAGVGELVLDGPCLRLKDSATTIWPAGFTPHFENGVVQVRNGAGRVIAKVGDEISGGGGYHNRRYGECSGEVFRANGIKVLPDVEIYFPRQDGTLAAGRSYRGFNGELVLNGKCLEVDDVIRVSDRSDVLGPVLLIWPGTFEVSIEDGVGKIVDSTGRVVARVGDKVQFDSFEVTYDQALEHGGLREITPACGAPYWAVGEELRVVETQ